jgi:hypothetical protein
MQANLLNFSKEFPYVISRNTIAPCIDQTEDFMTVAGGHENDLKTN